MKQHAGLPEKTEEMQRAFTKLVDGNEQAVTTHLDCQPDGAAFVRKNTPLSYKWTKSLST